MGKGLTMSNRVKQKRVDRGLTALEKMKCCSHPSCQSLGPLSEADLKAHLKLFHQSSTTFTVDGRCMEFDNGSRLILSVHL